MDKPAPKPRGPSRKDDATRRGWRGPWIEMSLVAAIDGARGDLSRAEWIRRAIKHMLAKREAIREGGRRAIKERLERKC